MTTKSARDARYRAAIGALRDGRLAIGLSQAELAKTIGRSQQFVSKYESFERRLDVIEFLDISRALGVDWASALHHAYTVCST